MAESKTMRNAITRRLLIVLLFTVALPLSASNSADYDILNSHYHDPLFTAFTESLYNAEPITRIYSHYDELVAHIAEIDEREPAALLYAHATVLLGKHLAVEEYCLDQDAGKSYLKIAEKALHESSFSSEAFRSQAYAIEAELAGGLFLINPIENLFTYGLASSKLIDKALEYDEENFHAQLMLGNRYLHAPILFGGSVRKARKVAEICMEMREGLPDFELFSLYLLRTIISTRTEDAETARQWRDLSLEIYPGNRYIQSFFDDE